MATDEARQRLLSAVAQAWRLLMGDNFSVLVLDDWHWGDSASVDLWSRLDATASADAAPVAWIIGYRSAQLPQAALVRQRADLDSGRGVAVGLEGMDEGEVLVLTQALSGAAGGRLFSQRLHRATEGNPFFLLETLRHLFEQRLLAADASGWSTPFDEHTESYAELPVPGSVRSAVLARVRALGSPVQRLLEVASLGGDEIDARLLAASASSTRKRRSPASSMPPRRSSSRRSRPAGASPTTWSASRWCRASRPAGAASCTNAWRAGWRRKALRRRSSPRSGKRRSGRPRRSAGGSPPPWQRCACMHSTRRSPPTRWPWPTAPRARTRWRFAWPAPRCISGAAIAAAADAEFAAAAFAAASDPQTASREVLRVKLAQVEHLCMTDRIDAGLEALDALEGEFAAAAPEVRARALAIRGAGLIRQSKFSAAEAPMTEAVALFEGRPESRRELAALLLDLGRAANWRGETDTWGRYARRAVAVYESLDDNAGLATALASLGLYHKYKGEGVEALAVGERARALAARSGNPTVHRIAIFNLVQTHMDTGRTDPVLALLDEGEALAPHFENRMMELNFQAARFFVHFLRGEVEPARTSGTRLLDISKRALHPLRRVGYLHMVADLHVDLGDWATVRALVDEAQAACDAQQADGDRIWFLSNQALKQAMLAIAEGRPRGCAGRASGGRQGGGHPLPRRLSRCRRQPRPGRPCGGETLARASRPPRACAGGCTRPLRRAALAAGRRGRTQRRRRDGPRRIHARRRARAGPPDRAAAPRPRGFAALIPGRRKAALAPGHAPSGDAAAGRNAFNALSTPGFLS